MSEQIIDFIKTEFEKKVHRNPRYSLRAFAGQLDIEHSTLSKILSGTRPLSFEMANKILTAMDLQISLKNSLLLTMSDPSNYSPAAAESDFVTLTEKELAATFQWHFFAILCALEIESVTPTENGLMDYLKLPAETIQLAVNTLERLGAIKRNENHLVLTGKQYSTTNNIPSQALIKAHVDHIEKSLEYLKYGQKKCDFTGVTLAIPIQKLDEAKRRITEFRRSISSWLSEDSMPFTDVYRLNFQFFPLASISESPEKAATATSSINKTNS